jgi:hypothetical protein
MPFSYNPLLGVGLDKSIPLDGAGKIPSTFLPSYVDDVEEYNNLAAFPATGETGKIYVAIDTGFAYRWSGSVYVQIGITAAAGATTQVQFNDAGAFGGDSGLTFNKTTDALSAGGFIPTSSTVPANGVYLPAANSVGVATNGTGRLFVDASGNVGVGIVSTTLWGYANLAGGTTVHRLLARQADAFLGISGTSTTAELNFGLLNALSSPTLVARISTVNTITTNNGERADLAFYTKSGAVSTVAQERLRITAAGLVGIGASAPADLLHLGGATNKQLRIDSSSSPSYVGSYNGTLNLAANRRTSDGIIVDSARSAAYIGISSDVGPSSVTISTASAIDTQPSARVTVNGLGNVGIGDTAPDSTLTIKAATSVVPLRVSGPSSEFARIDTSGRLLVGTSSDSGGALFQVNGDRIRVGTAKTPATSGATGTTGEIAWDADYIYVCTATNTWKRSAIATW